MSYRIAICDDEPFQSNYLKSLVMAWSEEKELDCSVKTFSSAESLLFHGCEEFDILLLDIEMAGMNGVELAKRVRERDETSVIIFVTGYSEYIAEGYAVFVTGVTGGLVVTTVLVTNLGLLSAKVCKFYNYV